MIRELETLLPGSSTPNFRERLVAYLENLEETAGQGNADPDLRPKAEALLVFYEIVFGVKDLVEEADEV
jgi:hypothetical protein